MLKATTKYKLIYCCWFDYIWHELKQQEGIFLGCCSYFWGAVHISGVLFIFLGCCSYFWGAVHISGVLFIFLGCCSYFWGAVHISGVLFIFLGCCSYFWGAIHISGVLFIFLGCCSYFWGAVHISGVLFIFLGCCSYFWGAVHPCCSLNNGVGLIHVLLRCPSCFSFPFLPIGSLLFHLSSSFLSYIPLYAVLPSQLRSSPFPMV